MPRTDNLDQLAGLKALAEPDPIELGDGPPSAEQVDAVLARLDGHVAASTGLPPAAPAERRLSGFEVARLGEVDPASLAAAPAEVQAAHEALLAALDAVRAAERRVAELPRDRADEERKADTAVADALAAGRTPKSTGGTDWPAEQQHRERVARVAGARLTGARKAFDAAAARALPGQRDALRTDVMAARDRAVETFGPALEAFRAWRATVTALAVLERRLDPRRADLLHREDHEAGRIRAEGEGGIERAAALLASDHPVHVGDWATREAADDPVPVHIRRWALDAGDAAVYWLAGIEYRERYSVTAFTAGMESQVVAHGGDEMDPPDPRLPQPGRRY